MRLVIEAHRHQAFAWGKSDCSLFADVVMAITGFDPLNDCRGYRSEIGARRILRRAGFESVLQLVAARFEEIPPAFAQRGDLGFPVREDDLMSPAVIDGAHAFSKDQSGMLVIPRGLVARAFAV